MKYNALQIMTILFISIVTQNLIWAQSWTWTELSTTSAPPGRRGHAGIPFDVLFIIFGGDLGGTFDNEIYLLDMPGSTWSPITPMSVDRPTPRFGHTMIDSIVDGELGLLIFGGNDGSLLNDLWFYNLATDEWMEITGTSGDIPPPMMGCSAVSLILGTGEMIIFGGYTGSGYSNEIYSYSPPPVNEWTLLSSVTDPPPPRTEQSAILIPDSTGDTILIFGGKDSSVYFNDLWKFDLASTTWTEISAAGDIPAARASHTAVYNDTDNQMIVFGGETPVCNDDTYILNLSTNNWTELIPLISPDARAEHVSIWDNLSGSYSRMVTYGGNCITTVFSDTWEFSVQPDTPTPTGSPATPTPSLTPGVSSTPTITSTPLPLCDTRYPRAHDDIGGGTINPSDAIFCDSAPASIPAGDQELQLFAFDNAYIGNIFNVRITITYRTSAAPAKDSYRFEASLDGSFGSPVTIVPENYTNVPTFQTVKLDLGAISYTSIGTLAIREAGRKGPGSPDSYFVEWDCCFIELYGICMTPTPSLTPTQTPTGTWYSPIPTDTPTQTNSPTFTNSPTITVTPTFTLTSVPTRTFTPSLTPTNTTMNLPAGNQTGVIILLGMFAIINIITLLCRRLSV
ncbi:MAG: hypothetical protein A2161_17100 [Candidatus Schekmanbacteria bacterium RBG_13_48_7]|uniref:Uncharacterized protein n=1 Tax=Candidatus Schekmanbacteria bacterium RBG_13_48_7 TaxID=1817878 RepID=A0A1F7S0G9_9BACT|nr:MAG: hypothetical protein A2161_17100 [Candidatus Schekmanbacteria bacterium RBG_13_48_7]